MDEETVKKLDRKRFNALAGHSRNPATSFFARELEWFSNEQETVIGALLVDTDGEFTFVIMGRDEGGRFRAIDMGAGYETREKAVQCLKDRIVRYTAETEQVFPQGDERPVVDLFAPVAPEEKLHPHFVRLNNHAELSSAKAVISELMPHFVDVDGNFVEQFQTTGFDARLWELYLDTYLTEEQLFKDSSHNAPDFLVTKYGKRVAIEAVIVGISRKDKRRT
jgi:hypothetical protein